MYICCSLSTNPKKLNPVHKPWNKFYFLLTKQTSLRPWQNARRLPSAICLWLDELISLLPGLQRGLDVALLLTAQICDINHYLSEYLCRAFSFTPFITVYEPLIPVDGSPLSSTESLIHFVFCFSYLSRTVFVNISSSITTPMVFLFHNVYTVFRVLLFAPVTLGGGGVHEACREAPPSKSISRGIPLWSQQDGF